MATDSTTTDSMTTNLTIFRHLILEMRIEIWKSLLEGNRIMAIDNKTRPNDRCVVVDDDAAATITRVCLPQILLQICHEARGVALKTLNAHVDVMQPSGAIFRILFNSNDTIFVNEFRRAAAPLFASGLAARGASCFSNLRHLAVHENNLYRFSLRREGDKAFINAIAKIPSLESLSIIKSKKNGLLNISTDCKLVKYLNENVRNRQYTTSQRDEIFKTQRCLISWSTRPISLEDITTPFMRYKEKNPSWKLPAVKAKTLFNVTEISNMIDEGINKHKESLLVLIHYSIQFIRTKFKLLDEWIDEAEGLVREQKARILEAVCKSAELGMSPMVQLAVEVYLIQGKVLWERIGERERSRHRRREGRRDGSGRGRDLLNSKVPEWGRIRSRGQFHGRY